jgi:hypothetical protein
LYPFLFWWLSYLLPFLALSHSLSAVQAPVEGGIRSPAGPASSTSRQPISPWCLAIDNQRQQISPSRQALAPRSQRISFSCPFIGDRRWWISASHLTTGSWRWRISATCTAAGVWRWTAACSNSCYAHGDSGDLSVPSGEQPISPIPLISVLLNLICVFCSPWVCVWIPKSKQALYGWMF